MKSIGQIFIFSILKTFTKVFLITFCLQFHSLHLLGQIQENFDDNDLSINPPWSGNPDNFKTSSGMLQLIAPAVSGSSFITTASTLALGAAWEFQVILNFNPSSSNFCRIYLTSDQENLNENLDGYFVQLGNSTDEVSLYKQKGSGRVEIVDGLDGRLNTDTVKVRIRVERSPQGEWQLFSMLPNETEFFQEGSATNNEFLISSHAGIQCVYTSTRSDKFLFDNFSIAPLPDVVPPSIVEMKVASETELSLTFNEVVSESTAQDYQNYSVTTIGNPVEAILSDSHRVVSLNFRNPFIEGSSYSLMVTNLMDTSGNVMVPDTVSFQFFQHHEPTFKDVVINEIMADPSPPVGLPEAEFLELFNRSNHALDISGWKISDGSTTGVIEDGKTILPGNYLIITSTSSAPLFTSFGDVIPLKSFPSLNNSGDKILLLTNADVKIDSVTFSSAWYRSSEKNDGGWSLEIIDPDNFCSGKDNWVASESDAGGTPGEVNSADAENLDLTGPLLLQAYLVMPDTLRMIFDEPLSSIVPPLSSFILSPSKLISNVSLHAPYSSLDLILSDPLLPGEILTLTLQNVFDCSGNEIRTSSPVQIFFPEPADSLDVVINEVLFNPRTNGVDFVEVYNRSGKFIELSGWSFANLEDSTIVNRHPVAHPSLFLKPHDQIAFSEDPGIVGSEYPLANEENNFQTELPAMNDDAGSVALISPQGKVMDVFYYSEAMHSVFVKSDDGVSLERISPEIATNIASNWKSAATGAGYATPGGPNSNAASADPGSADVSVIPEVFLPISGQPDYTRIEYHFSNSGYVATVRIFDQQSRVVKTIQENALLGNDGFFRWDGDCDDGSKAPVGNYMVRFDVFGDNGSTKVVRKRVAIAARF